MSERDVKIAETAFDLFAHYSVSKTSMAEIASKAGVARQTVYNSFENKEDLIFAALLHYATQFKAKIELDCAELTALEARLETLFNHLVITPFLAMQKYPHLDEILVIGENLSHERKKQIQGTYKSAIRHVFLPFEIKLTESGVDPFMFYDLLKLIFVQIKREAKDTDHLEQLFEPFKVLLFNLIRQPIH